MITKTLRIGDACKLINGYLLIALSAGMQLLVMSAGICYIVLYRTFWHALPCALVTMAVPSSLTEFPELPISPHQTSNFSLEPGEAFKKSS